MKLRGSVFGSLCLVAGITLVTAAPASAALTTYVGEDLVFTAAPPPAAAVPNSIAAATAFVALGPSTLIDFEGAPLGAFSSLTVAPGVTLSGNQSIRNTTNFPTYPSVDGYNITPGGSYFVEVKGGSLTFTFAQPIYSFGAFLSGVQTNFFADRLSFFDGSNQSITLLGAGTSSRVGELAYVGFNDPGRSITSVTIVAGDSNGTDFIGVDNVRFRNVAVPEPATWAMMIIGFGAAGSMIRRRKALVA